MDQAFVATWIAPGAALLGALIVLGQVMVQRRQRHLQEAEAHRQQADAWAALADSWETALLPAAGVRAGWHLGVPNSKATQYIDAVERYRLAYTAWLEPLTGAEGSSDQWEKLAAEEREAREALAPFQRAVQQVVTHLAQVSGLVLRKQFSLEVAYDAFGLQVIRVGDQLFGLLRSSYDHGGDCVAPGNMERGLWKHLKAEEVSARIGWGAFLDVARGSAERIVLFVSLLMAHAVKVGDLDDGFENGTRDAPAELLADRDRLAVAWRGARFYGRLRAVRLVWTLAATGRRVTARAFRRWFGARVRGVWTDKERGWRRRLMRLFLQRSLAGPLVACLVLSDVIAAARRAHSVKDIRRMDPPWIAAKELGVDQP